MANTLTVPARNKDNWKSWLTDAVSLCFLFLIFAAFMMIMAVFGLLWPLMVNDQSPRREEDPALLPRSNPGYLMMAGAVAIAATWAVTGFHWWLFAVLGIFIVIYLIVGALALEDDVQWLVNENEEWP